MVLKFEMDFLFYLSVSDPAVNKGFALKKQETENR